MSRISLAAAFVPVFALVAAGCTPSDETDGGDKQSDDGWMVCSDTCSSAADCANGLDAVHEGDNYACKSGGCVYEGCNADSECQELFGIDEAGCLTTDGFGACVRTCAGAEDCAVAGQVGFAAANYACTGGLCDYQGCLDDTDCMGGTGSGSVCRAYDGAVPTCVEGCANDADCAQAGGDDKDADNWECKESGCRYLGCSGDDECAMDEVCQ